LIRVHFYGQKQEDFDANAAAPFGTTGVLLSKLASESGFDLQTRQPYTKMGNPQLGHVAPQLVVVLPDFRRIEWIPDAKPEDGQSEP
jgi:hypothetical protein